MRSLRSFAVLALLSLLPRTATAQQQDVIIKGGWRFDSARETMVRNTSIIVKGGAFYELDSTRDPATLRDARVVQLTDDEFILPGMFDMHGHYNVDLFGKGRIDELHYIPMIYLANGVTSTWPAGEFDPDGMAELRNRIDSGKQIGPRIFNSGPYFGTARPGWSPATSPEQVRADVDYWASKGARRFKAKGINAAQLRALIEQAHLHGLTVSGHLGSGLGGSVNPKDAIEMGIDGIEHILGGDILDPRQDAYRGYLKLQIPSKEFSDIIDEFKSHGVFYSPTMTAVRRSTDKLSVFAYWIDERKLFTPYTQEYVATNPPYRHSTLMDSLFDVKMRELKAVYEAGVPLLVSTDVQSVGTYIAGFNFHRELQTFVEAGIPPAAAIKAATWNAARALNVLNKLGSIEPGKFADLVVVKGDPLKDIRNTHNVRLVMKSGFIYDPQAILKEIEGKLGPADASEAPKWMRSGQATS